MYYNPEYMNPIMKGLNKPAQPQQGIASLAPQMTPPPGGIQPIPEQVKLDPSLRGGGGSLFPFPGMNSTEVGTVDPIMQGFENSEFRKNANMIQQDAVNFKYKGEDKMMNSSMAGAFKQYLDSIGKGDLYESNYELVQDQTPLQGLPLGQHPLMGNFDHLTDNPYAAGPPDDFVTIEGVRHYVGGAQQATPPQPPTAPPLTQTAPPQTNYSPGVMPPGWQNTQQFNPNQGIASLAGTNPGI
tara:strand:+ start:152 stop:874 length:723 start_codon:yes stop_codon:yes gene_type:complete